MHVRVASGDITQTETQCVVVNLFQGVVAPAGASGAVDRALSGMLTELIAAGDITGKWGELTLLHTIGRALAAPRVLVAGLGTADEFTIDRVRDLSANIARLLGARRIRDAATITHGAGLRALDAESCAQAIAEGALLGSYRFDAHKQPEEDATRLKTLTIVENDQAKVAPLTRGAERGVIVAEAANFARDLANEPSNVLTPTEFAARAETMAREEGLGCRILDRDECQQMGMGSFLGVAKGSQQPPKFIVLTYRGAGDARPLGLIGKGITFDTGGISIKPAAGMEEMKADMTGGACVVAAMRAIARLRPAVNVTALVPATENMPGGGATKPGDVLRAMNGKTIEVINTDAEGRLVLADALSYAVKLDLSPLVDVATLTAAIGIALGDVAYGVFSNNDALVGRLRASATAAGEKCWEMPMFAEYRDAIKSPVADMRNSGGRNAGAIFAAFFLKEFIDDRPWAHLDIAGVDFVEKEKGVLVKGSSGIPVRTLVNLVLSYAPAAEAS
ncbi:MAG: leucyl aminopeptidase [Dehalococcoidia bacterium]|nr:leucyl aminopeptidase [Dehalococcoidia bacterium]